MNTTLNSFSPKNNLQKNESFHLDWSEVLDVISAFATSETGKEILRELAPAPSSQEAQTICNEILRSTKIIAGGLRPHLQSIDFFSVWGIRLRKKAVLKPLELKDVRNFCLEALALREACEGLEDTWIQNQCEGLMKAEEPLSAIDQILTPGGDIRSDASETLYRLHQEKERLGRDLHSQLDKIVKDNQLESLLQDKYVTTREGRWVVPVKGGRQHYVPGVIHASSQSKQTVFIEPEKVVPINNRLRQVEVEIEEEIERLLEDLSKYLAGHIADFEITRTQMELFDARLAEAQFALKIEGVAIEFAEGELKLNDLKHPLLVVNGKTVVANSVVLDGQKSILLLSGPNAGGKTVLLKSIGLASHMARCGLPVCAGPESKVPFFNKIQVSIGDSQSVGEDLSTFAAHLKKLTEATQIIGSQNLVLIDEICGSTDPEEGSVLARSFIEAFEKNNIFAVVTSHLSPLKSAWPEDSKILNGSLEYNSHTGRPSYQFISGLPGDSLALQTAIRVGVPKNITDRAKELLSPAAQARLQGLEEMESLKKDIAKLQEHLKKETSAAQALKKKYELMVEDFEKEKQHLLVKTLKKAEQKVEEAIKHTKVEDVFKRHRQLQDVKFQLPEIVKAKAVDIGSNGLAQAPNTKEEFLTRFPPGSKVFIPSLGQDALVQSEPNSKGEILILSGSVRLQVNWREVKPPNKPHNPTADLVRRSGSISVQLHDVDPSLDVRGKTANEAIEELEMTLDQAVMTKQDRLKVIHGHGTEVLKKSVRAYLSRSMYVKKWKAGGPETGGDGITWVELNIEG